MNYECDVLILGAGAAGIGAARQLLEDSEKNASTYTLKVVVLEARDRIGGRTWTSDELRLCGGSPELDHGGKWIHGGDSSTANPMTELAARYQIPTMAWNDDNNIDDFRKKKRRCGNIKRVVVNAESSGEKMKSVVPSREAETASKRLYKQLCQMGRGSLIAPLKNNLSVETSYKDCLLEIANKEMPGKSFAEWLEAKTRNTLVAAENPIKKVTPLLIAETIALLRHRVYHCLESYEGCRLDEGSLLHTMAGTILPGGNADVAGGYGKLVQTLATSVSMDIRFGHRVLSIDRTSSVEQLRDDNPQGVVVVCEAEEEGSKSEKRFVARLGCIVTLPLGVLQSSVANPKVRGPVFVPPLPGMLLGAIDRLGVCLMNKIEMLFPSQWWPDGTGFLTIASENGNANDFPLGNMPWSHWIVEEDDPPILVCYATGVFAERIETMTNEEIETEGVEALRLAFLDDVMDNDHCNTTHGIAYIPDPVRTHVTRWRSDPFARGSWTVFKAGTKGMEDVHAFQQFNSKQRGVGNLYFAGEHTCDGSVDGLDIGTVHGAYLSGTLAAKELLVHSRTKSANS